MLKLGYSSYKITMAIIVLIVVLNESNKTYLIIYNVKSIDNGFEQRVISKYDE